MSEELLSVDDQLILQEEDGVDPYVFRTSSQECVFYLIQEEMEELNDYCVVSISAIQEVLNKERDQAYRYAAGHDTLIHPDDGDVTDNALMGLEDYIIPKWQQIHSFLSHATCLLLLNIFFEKSLKSLCLHFNPNKSNNIKIEKGKSKIDGYLSFLSKNCNIQVDETVEVSELRDGIRRIRNAFAHGDWDIVRETTKMYELKKCFTVIAMLFENIEIKLIRK